MASLPYTPDVVNLDLTDPTNPKLVGRLHITEPFANVGAQSVHTVLPLWDRDLLFVSSEARKENCNGRRSELRRHDRQHQARRIRG